MSGGSDPRCFDVSEDSALRLLWILLPMLSFIGVTAWHLREPAPFSTLIFDITASPPYFTMGGSPGWSLLVAVTVTGVLCWKYFQRRVQLDNGVLTVWSTFYRRRTAVVDMQLDEAVVVDMARDRRHGLQCRTNAYSLPGFHSGHYRLRGGGKGFALVTDLRRVLVIPVREGPTLLLSVEQPQQLLQALRNDRG